MTSLAGVSGERAGEGAAVGVDSSAALDYSVYQDMQHCIQCGGPQMFVPVDRFPCGWRGYCLGCGEVKYVMDERTSSEAA